MGTFLIYPVHRKFIRLLRDYVDKNSSLLLTESDIEGFKNLFSRTTKNDKRHRGLYKLTLQAMNRQTSGIKKAETIGVIGYPEIRIIEKKLAKVERKSIFQTLLATLLWYCKKK